MTHQIILIVLVSFLVFLPFFYKRSGRLWRKFYLSMALSEESRKMYVLVLTVLILSVNFLQYRISGPNLWLIPGFLVGLLSLKFKWTDAVLRWLHKDRMLQLLALAFFFIVSMDARLFTLAVTFALTIDFSFFYPSQVIIEMAEKEPKVTVGLDNKKLLALYY